MHLCGVKRCITETLLRRVCSWKISQISIHVSLEMRPHSLLVPSVYLWGLDKLSLCIWALLCTSLHTFLNSYLRHPHEYKCSPLSATKPAERGISRCERYYPTNCWLGCLILCPWNICVKLLIKWSARTLLRYREKTCVCVFYFSIFEEEFPWEEKNKRGGTSEFRRWSSCGLVVASRQSRESLTFSERVAREKNGKESKFLVERILYNRGSKSGGEENRRV